MAKGKTKKNPNKFCLVAIFRFFFPAVFLYFLLFFCAKENECTKEYTNIVLKLHFHVHLMSPFCYNLMLLFACTKVFLRTKRKRQKLIKKKKKMKRKWNGINKGRRENCCHLLLFAKIRIRIVFLKKHFQDFRIRIIF